MTSLTWTTILAATALISCNTETAPKASAPSVTSRVEVSRATELEQTLGYEVMGTVRARSRTAVSSSVMGTIKKLHVAIGSRVEAGDILVQLSAREIEARVNQARAIYTQNTLELRRAEQLKQTQSIATHQYEAAAAAQSVAQAALAESEVMRGYTILRAPFAGVVAEKQCEVGDLALPGVPLLVIETPEALRLEAPIPEGSIHFVHVGDSVAVRFEAVDGPLVGVVGELNPSADPTTRTVLAKIDLPPTPSVRPGMFGRMTVATGKETSLTVPKAAVLRRGQMETIFVVENNQARLRLVRTGREYGPNVEVLSGLAEDETVASSGHKNLVDGQQVSVGRP